MQECIAGIHSFDVKFDYLYVKGVGYHGGPYIAYICCSGEHGSGPLSADEVLAILDGAEPVVEWESDPANDYIYWRVQDPLSTRGRHREERIASLLAAQLTLCLAGLWPRVKTPSQISAESNEPSPTI